MTHGNVKCILMHIFYLYRLLPRNFITEEPNLILCLTGLSVRAVSAVLNYTHILAARGFTHPMHINCCNQKQNWERHVGLCLKGGHTYWNSCIALLDSPSHTWEHSAIGGCITVSRRRRNWGRTVPLCGFTVGHSFSDMQGINQEPGLLGFSACKHRIKFTWSYCGNCVPIDVQLIRPQLFSKSKKQSLASSRHIKAK